MILVRKNLAPLWVARLDVSPSVRTKIEQVHHCTEAEVRDAIVCVRGLTGAEEEAGKFVLKVKIRGAWHLVALYQSARDPHDFALATAHPIDQ